MGDRATFVIEGEKNTTPIFIYGHWAGEGMMNEFANAISHALPRIGMGDVPYATRMIFNYLTRDSSMAETGWGLSTYFCESEHSVPVLNIPEGTVRLLPHDWSAPFDINAEPKFVMSVDNFVKKFSKSLQAV